MNITKTPRIVPPGFTPYNLTIEVRSAEDENTLRYIAVFLKHRSATTDKREFADSLLAVIAEKTE